VCRRCCCRGGAARPSQRRSLEDRGRRAEGLLLVAVSNLARRLDWLKGQGVWVIGADGAAPRAYDDGGFHPRLRHRARRRGARHARAHRRLCDELVSIPMRGTVSSLNVSVAAGILLFEAMRQRRG
jgi:23S rRNA (guanosine2251-2'-O)-methyltransferase